MSEKTELDRERKDRYLAKAEKIETRASDIKDWIGDMSEKGFEEDKRTRLAVYKAFQELVEAVGDICAMFASDTLKAVGDDYENVEKGAGELYGKGLKKTLKRANGLRNRLVHEYNQLSNKIAYDSIRELLPSLRKFGEETRDWIKNR